MPPRRCQCWYGTYTDDTPRTGEPRRDGAPLQQQGARAECAPIAGLWTRNRRPAASPAGRAGAGPGAQTRVPDHEDWPHLVRPQCRMSSASAEHQESETPGEHYALLGGCPPISSTPPTPRSRARRPRVNARGPLPKSPRPVNRPGDGALMRCMCEDLRVDLLGDGVDGRWIRVAPRRLGARDAEWEH